LKCLAEQCRLKKLENEMRASLEQSKLTPTSKDDNEEEEVYSNEMTENTPEERVKVRNYPLVYCNHLITNLLDLQRARSTKKGKRR
jgi:hypothetical protein